ncbi:hypothetical protein [Heyndrickxia sporothermodurans]|uniref:hypothetical protein n=1 Tax=Heyndrickxia sporothermodurans TaxID=46224 RepID=UPI00192C57D8|nr:hypothetical protein [Heyndrickxia sporothermodurans]MBL5769016.1 hypothetical protein [Heyndrickxia sporothermodurans]MBL5772803.1 hypothetical protein [Heyndrickxia sporothermodurans]MBL5783369.1 hypothetical protein [Heyndrickxia sporothermodurans]MBL5786891.1 hypothetical protein [Heyndrickxia sporothermodurans]MBL5790508.1 hypothetical protein [Heyndrickxia sporothermodurans]
MNIVINKTSSKQRKIGLIYLVILLVFSSVIGYLTSNQTPIFLLEFIAEDKESLHVLLLPIILPLIGAWLLFFGLYLAFYKKKSLFKNTLVFISSACILPFLITGYFGIYFLFKSLLALTVFFALLLIGVFFTGEQEIKSLWAQKELILIEIFKPN